jgi:hypothetical protein
MTTTPLKAEVLKLLEANAHSADEIMTRAIEALQEMAAGHDALEALARHQIDTRLAASSFIVEAAALLVEHETGFSLPDVFADMHMLQRTMM